MERDTILILMICGGDPEQAVGAILEAIDSAKTDKLNFRIGQHERDGNAFHLVFRRNPEMIQYYYTADAGIMDWLKLMGGGLLMAHKYVGLMFQGDRDFRRGWGKQLLQSNKEIVDIGTIRFVRHDVLAQKGFASLFLKRPLTISTGKG